MAEAKKVSPLPAQGQLPDGPIFGGT